MRVELMLENRKQGLELHLRPLNDTNIITRGQLAFF